MKVQTTVSVKDSITTRLMKNVFTLYFLIAVTVTIIHMVSEYTHEWYGVFEKFQFYHQVFHPALTKGMWEVDDAQLQSIVTGIAKLPLITGVRIVDENRGFSLEMGNLPANVEAAIVSDHEKSIFQETFGHSFGYTFPIIYVHSTGRSEQLGELSLFSNSHAVFNTVRYGFIFLMINALIKTIALWVIFLLVARKVLAKPLALLTAVADQLSFQTLDHVKVEFDTSGRNELKVLEDAFNTMIYKLITAKEELSEINSSLEEQVRQRTESLKQALEELRKKDKELQKELDLAAEIQKGILPTTPIHLPPIDVVSHYETMGKVGGDFYDIFRLPDGRACVVIADAMGHGVPAAFLTVMAKISFGDILHRETNPKCVMREVNRMMSAITKNSEYLTAFILMFNTKGEIHYSNAAHPAAVLMRRNQDALEFWDTRGSMVGFFEDDEVGDSYQESQGSWQSGDRLFLYTDGIIDARNIDREIFGEERLFSLLQETRLLPLADACRHIRQTLKAFVGAAPAWDDITFLLLEYGTIDASAEIEM